MSETGAPPEPVPSNTFWNGQTLVSTLTLLLFAAAMVIAWVTKDATLPVLLGIAGAKAGTVVDFWLGSASSSRGKDRTIADLAKPVH